MKKELKVVKIPKSKIKWTEAQRKQMRANCALFYNMGVMDTIDSIYTKTNEIQSAINKAKINGYKSIIKFV